MINALIERSQYPSLNECVYLNQASLGLIAQPAVQAMRDFLENVAMHGNLRMSDSDEASFFESLRQRGARILNCESDQLAILASASELLGQFPYLLQPKSGDNIVLVSTDFPAVTRPWLRYASENDCSLRFVDDIATENLSDKLIEKIDSRTAVVAVSSVQFSTGTLVDIPRLQLASTSNNAHFIVDVTQAAGTLRIDSRSWEADAVVTSGYKWLGGHGGVALAALSPNILELVPPLPGWMGASAPFEFDATKLLFADGAHRFTQSTMSYVSMVGLTTALDSLLSIGEIRIEEHARTLSNQLIEGVRGSEWKPFRPIDDPSAAPHIVTLEHPKLCAESTVGMLRENQIVCACRNNRIRISIAPYNNSDDIDAVIDVLANV